MIVQELVYWNDVVESGLVFGIGNLLYYLLHIVGYSFLQLLASVLFSLLLLCFGYVLYYRLKSQLTHVPFHDPLADRLKNNEFIVTPEHLQDLVRLLVALINQTLRIFQRLYYFADLISPLKVLHYHITG